MKHLILCDNSAPERAAPLCREAGLGIELQHFHDPEYRPNVEHELSLLEGVKLRSMHGPFWDMLPGTPDPLIAEATLKRFLRVYSYAQQYRCSYLVLHNGFSPMRSFLRGWADRAVRFWESFLSLTEAHGPTCCIENSYEYDPSLIREVVDRVNSPRLKINLDVAHTNCFSRTPALRWVEELGDRIVYTHLHQNDGSADQHLALDQGTIPMLEVCQALEKHAPLASWAIEARGQDAIARSLSWLRDHKFAETERCTDVSQ